MDMRAIDFRKSWMRELFLGLKQSFVSVEEKLNTTDWYDGLDAKEQMETIYGIAFVAAQTYITGTISDICKIRGENYKTIKPKMLSSGSPIIVDKVTKVFLVNTIANFYKHNEEWNNWNPKNNNKKTIETLAKCGITENTDFPCYKVATMLWREEELCELNYLLDILVEWRKSLLSNSESI